MIEKIAGSMFLLILLFLLIKNADAANNAISAFGNAVTFNVSALQGKQVSV